MQNAGIYRNLYYGSIIFAKNLKHWINFHAPSSQLIRESLEYQRAKCLTEFIFEIVDKTQISAGYED